MNNYVLCDIGDGQSITENLSTFSAHIQNIIQILKLADNQSLVLLDELGSGTDPAEGMGLAIAILEELLQKNCLFVATTHYPEIKEYAKTTPNLINARMAFDRQTLLPLYKLEIGEAGESCALYIAQRLGLSPRIIKKAYIAAYSYNSNKNITHIKSLPSLHQENPEPISQARKRIIEKENKKNTNNKSGPNYNIGDSVIVYPQKEIGIVYQTVNEKGEVGVQIKKEKQLINHKRLKLNIPADKLYPENYDFSIIFDSVEDRKKRHDMSRKYDPKLIIETTNE